MNTSQTKIRKIQEANRIAEERFLMSEQSTPDIPTTRTLSRILPTDYNKPITFLFSDGSTAIIKPEKKDISISIIELMGLGDNPTNNTIDLRKSGGAVKICGNNQFDKKVYIYPINNKNININKLCDIFPKDMRSLGIFEVPYNKNFIDVITKQ